MKEETSYCFIKPEAEEHRLKIHNSLQMRGIPFTFRRVRLREIHVAGLYDIVDPALTVATIMHLCVVPVEVIKVTCVNAVDIMLKMRGSSMNPLECEPDSFRRLYGRPEPVRISQTRLYFLNGFHAPKPKEVSVNNCLFEEEFQR